MPCDPNFLVKIKMFELLNEDDRAALASVVDELKVPANHTLFQAGDPGDSLFIVNTGRIELFIKDTAGQKIVPRIHTRRHENTGLFRTVSCDFVDRVFRSNQRRHSD